MLFKSTPEIMAVNSSASSNINFASIRPKVEQAATSYLLPRVGRQLLSHIATAYSGSTPLNPAQLQVLTLMQKVVAAWALWHYVPVSEVSLTDGGAFRNETETSKTAYQNQVNNLRDELMAEAYSHEENLLSHLYSLKPENPVAEPEAGSEAYLYNLFANSAEYTRYNQLFITGPADLQQQYHTAQPGRNYHAIRPLLYDVQQLIMPHIVSPQLYKRMLQLAQAKNSPTQPTELELWPQLIEMVKKYLTYTTLHRGIASKALSWDARGITAYMGSTKATRDEDSKRGNLSADHFNHFATELHRQADEWKAALSFYLQQHSSNLVFPEYFEWWQAATAQPAIEAATPQDDFDNTFGLF